MIDLKARARLFDEQRMKKLAEEVKNAISSQKSDKVNTNEGSEELLKHLIDRVDFQGMLLAYCFNALKIIGETLEEIEKNTRKGKQIKHE